MDSLSDGSWRKTFPGKELFREISGYISPNNPLTGGHLDLAEAVGHWQRTNEKIPAQIIELRSLVLVRV